MCDLSDKKIVLNLNFMFDGYGDFEWYHEIYNILTSNNIKNYNIILLASFDNLSTITDEHINDCIDLLSDDNKELFKIIFSNMYVNIKLLDDTKLLVMIKELESLSDSLSKKYLENIIKFKKYFNYNIKNINIIYLYYTNLIKESLTTNELDLRDESGTTKLTLDDNQLLIIKSYTDTLKAPIKYIGFVESGRCGTDSVFYCPGIDNTNPTALGLHYNEIEFMNKSDFFKCFKDFIIEHGFIDPIDFDKIIYHYAYTRKHEDTSFTFYNKVIIYQYLLLKYYANLYSSQYNDFISYLYLFIYYDFLNSEEINEYFNVLRYLSEKFGFSYDKEIGEHTAYNIKIKINDKEQYIIIKVRFYRRLEKKLFKNMVYHSSSPIFSTGDLSQMEALGYKKVLISDYVEHRRSFINNFYNTFDTFIKETLNNVEDNKDVELLLLKNHMKESNPIIKFLFENILYINEFIKLNTTDTTDTNEIRIFKQSTKQSYEQIATKINSVVIRLYLYAKYINDFINSLVHNNVFKINFIKLIQCQFTPTDHFKNKYLKYKIKYMINKKTK